MIVRGDQRQVGLGHLDVVAEDPVEPDLQRGDPRARALALLDGRDGGPAATARLPQLVQLAVHAVPHEAALAGGGRRGLDERRLDVRGHVGQGIDVLQLAPHERGQAVLEGRGRARQRAQGPGQGHEVARARRAQRDPAQDPLEVLDRPHPFPEPAALDGPEAHLLDRVEPVLDGLDLGQRPQQPFPQAPRAHGRARQVQHLEQRAAPAAVDQVLDQLEVAPRDGVDDQAALHLARAQSRDVVQRPLLRVAQVAQGGAARRHGQRRRLAAEGLQRRHAELREQLPPRRAGIEGRVLELRARDRGLGLGRVAEPVGQGRGARHQQLARSRGRHLVTKARPAVGAHPFHHREVTGGGLQPGRAQAPFAGDHRDHEGRLARLHGRGLELRARGHHAHHLAAHHALGGPRVLHLLAERHAKPLLHEAGDVAGDRMVRHAAHGDGRAVLLLGARGERDVQGPGRHHRVVEEQLVEVSHAEEEQGLGVLRLHAVVLLHGGRRGMGRGGQGIYPKNTSASAN